MKIIQIDNFGRDHVSDALVAEKVNDYYAKFIVKKLNKHFSGVTSPLFYKAVPDDHKLYEFEP